MQSNWHGNDASRGEKLARNNGTKESCTDEVVIYEQMLVFFTGMSRNIKIKKKSL